MFDDELVDRIGYEAVEKSPEKHPIMLHNLSKRLVKAMVNHDMDLLNEDPDNHSKNREENFRISKNYKRLNPDFYTIGEVVKGRVYMVFPTYALVDIGSVCYGVLHARDMSNSWINRADMDLTPGDIISVYIKAVNSQRPTIRLSLRPLSDISLPGRRPLHSFKIEEQVTGRVTRRSPLGFYVDIGATVDAFLHNSDRKLSKKFTGEERLHLKIGTRVPILYIKGIDFIKNRIQVSENSLQEELNKRLVTGDETLGHQAAYLKCAKRDFMNELRVDELEKMKQIGGYDSLLSEIGGHRNHTTEYILYLENLRKKKELEKQQEQLFQDTSTKEKLRRDKERFNKLGYEIADLNEVSIEPKPFERSIYKYADSCVWSSKVYTPFNITDTDSYFNAVTDELTSALRDVQGENFNFASELGIPDNDLSKDRHELIEYLWTAFRAPPSELSTIPNESNDEILIDDILEVPIDDSTRIKERNERLSKIISELESTGDPEYKEFAEILRETKIPNPFAHSRKLFDDEKSAIKGASALFGEDVSDWTERARRLVLSDPSKLEEIMSNNLGGSLAYSDSVSDVPLDVLETEGDDNQGFVKPIITQGDLLGSKNDSRSVGYDNTSFDSDHGFTKDNRDTKNSSYSAYDGSIDTNYTDDFNVLEKKKSKFERINFHKLCNVLEKDLQGYEDKLSKVDLLIKKEFPTTVKNSYEEKVPSEYECYGIASILQGIKETTEKSQQGEAVSDDSKFSYMPNYLKMRDSLKEANMSSDVCSIASEQIIDASNTSEDCTKTEGSLETFDFGFDDLDEDSSEDSARMLKYLLKSKKGIKQLARFARRFLSPNELKYLDGSGNNPRDEEELAAILRSKGKKQEKTNYTYYPEGITNYVPPKDNRTEDKKIIDSKRRLENLKKNRRFLMMLRRLDIDPNNLSFDNILDKLPRQFVFERLPPFKKLKNS
ncbi:S1 RNA binding domain-containing protein [Theileria equi strain WA]|uniref:S1 RNA binding domain-containing protein n=1 Tax=Theileria equi strain WA TaxID=1537102 RepID=L0B3C4_THEEQ|nr:S1 RNA binding domain-containing protein [Theileria equi strain WA]AFZ81726.1 S1 RNA binding domain-containing protein [Theileria equi strain WA]|eukprot:XP_004831392.1 S1 RNA binding domain-containing protein [Theileria equi strain WA]